MLTETELDRLEAIAAATTPVSWATEREMISTFRTAIPALVAEVRLLRAALADICQRISVGERTDP